MSDLEPGKLHVCHYDQGENTRLSVFMGEASEESVLFRVTFPKWINDLLSPGVLSGLVNDFAFCVQRAIERRWRELEQEKDQYDK